MAVLLSSKPSNFSCMLYYHTSHLHWLIEHSLNTWWNTRVRYWLGFIALVRELWTDFKSWHLANNLITQWTLLKFYLIGWIWSEVIREDRTCSMPNVNYSTTLQLDLHLMNELEFYPVDYNWAFAMSYWWRMSIVIKQTHILEYIANFHIYILFRKTFQDRTRCNIILLDLFRDI